MLTCAPAHNQNPSPAQVVHGVRCTLVEPRPFKLSKVQCRLLEKQVG